MTNKLFLYSLLLFSAVFVLSGVGPVSAQEDAPCSPDLNDVFVTLAQAQLAFDEGDVDLGLDTLVVAQTSLATIEDDCRSTLTGGGDVVAAIEVNLFLGIADGSEHFQALGSDKIENPKPGEVIYFDSQTKNVMCRRWNWRNGNHTKIEVNSQLIVINVDCLPPITPETGIQARDELATLLAEHCDAAVETATLHKSSQEHTIL